MIDPIEQGQELMLNGNYQEAQDIFLEVLQRDSENDLAFYHLGLCHLAFENLSEAEACFRQCLEVNPRNVDALVDLGETEFANGDAELAMLSFGQAINLDEENARAYVSLARVEDFLGLNEAAVEHFEKAMTLAEPGEAPSYDLALAYAKVGKYLHADVILENLISDTLRRGAQTFIGDSFARDDLSDFIVEMRGDRENIRDSFLEEKGYPIEHARYMFEALSIARGMNGEELGAMLAEIRILRYAGLDLEGKTQVFRLHSLQGSFSGKQLQCYEYTFCSCIGRPQELSDCLKDAYDEAFNLLTAL